MEKRGNILVVDDEKNAREGLQELILSWGYNVESAADGESALQVMDKHDIDLVIADMIMPGIDGIELVKRIKEKYPETAVIILTAQGSINSAVEAIKSGSYDYLTKPVDIVRLKHTIEQAFERLSMALEVKRLKRQLSQYGSFGDLIGNTPQMKEIFHLIEIAAPTSANVLITGASGTGKDLVARAIHNGSPRRKGPFIAINCSAIPETLLESEIFGHERGAFTGAEKTKEGCYELADGGTLFLDEISEMSPDMQAKLLRVLETGTFRRVGGKVERKADVRIVSASNADLEAAIKEGLFREDLYYRLNVFCIDLPPLKDRADDIPLLVQAFLEEFNRKNNRNIKAVDPEAMNLLKSHSWPGNVRELRNVIERATIVCKSNIISPADLPPHMRPRSSKKPTLTLQIGTKIEDIEREVVLRTLSYAGGNKTRAAKMLGISLKTLHNKVNKYGIGQKKV